jgi:hypothetical protein
MNPGTITIKNTNTDNDRGRLTADRGVSEETPSAGDGLRSSCEEPLLTPTIPVLIYSDYV